MSCLPSQAITFFFFFNMTPAFLFYQFESFQGPQRESAVGGQLVENTGQARGRGGAPVEVWESRGWSGGCARSGDIRKVQ